MLVAEYFSGESHRPNGLLSVRTTAALAKRRTLTPADMLIVGPLVVWATWMQILCAPFPARTIDWAGQKKLPPNLD